MRDRDTVKAGKCTIYRAHEAQEPQCPCTRRLYALRNLDPQRPQTRSERIQIDEWLDHGSGMARYVTPVQQHLTVQLSN